ncbi:hypothetical protein [Nostoc sp. KVJ3]|nr:hypothetical protein [Nostoc sp. KVJ3]
MALLYIDGELVQINLALTLALTSIFPGILFFFLLAADILIYNQVQVI